MAGGTILLTAMAYSRREGHKWIRAGFALFGLGFIIRGMVKLAFLPEMWWWFGYFVGISGLILAFASLRKNRKAHSA